MNVKITVLLTEEGKKNLDNDIPKLRAQLQRRLGPIKLTRMDYIRGMLDDLHQNMEQGNEIEWPPVGKLRSKAKETPVPAVKPAPKRRKRK